MSFIYMLKSLFTVNLNIKHTQRETICLKTLATIDIGGAHHCIGSTLISYYNRLLSSILPLQNQLVNERLPLFFIYMPKSFQRGTFSTGCYGWITWIEEKGNWGDKEERKLLCSFYIYWRVDIDPPTTV